MTVFRDPQQKLATRVSDLLGRLSQAEKIALLHQHQAAVPRLGVAGFRTGTEALHGVAWLGPATVFPQAIGLATSWDEDLLRRVGTAVGTEVRAMHHRDPANVGLNVWAPVVNPLRDPRWGRNEEGYAEDPWLTGRFACAYAGGLRGDDPRRLRTAPTLKHFLGYNNETDRCLTSSDLPPRVLHEYELPAFHPALEQGAAVAVMASYNLVNGCPAHLSPLLDEVLRGWAGDDVLVVGDAYAVQNLAGDQQWHDDQVAGFAAALRAGVDCVTEPAELAEASFTAALERGLITESDVDAAVRRILSVRIRLGEFDDEDPYRGTGPEVIDCAGHRELAREAARASVVLLHNDGILPLDPAGAGRIAVLGPLADTVLEDWYSGTLPYARTLRDGIAERVGAAAVTYHEGVDRVRLRCSAGLLTADGGPLRVTPDAAGFDVLDWGAGIVSLRSVASGRTVGADGLGPAAHLLVDDRPGPNGWEVRETFRFRPAPGGVVIEHVQSRRYLTADADGLVRTAAETPADATVFTVELLADGPAGAAAVAAGADLVVLALGNHPLVNGRETEDRPDVELPAAQRDLLRAVRAANPRTVLVLTSGYPYAIGPARDRPPAVLWSSHGGQEHGGALADVLFGSDPAGAPVDPAGRLTQTWYTSANELPDLLDYDIIATDATYLYYRGAPLFGFGHGLSYTAFHYENLALSAAGVDADGEIEVSVDVVNTGDRPGTEVVQLYTRQRRSRVKQPLRRLRGFRRLRLAPGERARVTLPLRAADLAIWDVTRRRRVVEDAPHTVSVGRSSTDLRQAATLTVRGEHIPARDPRLGLHLVDNDGYHALTTVPADRDPGEALRSAGDGGWAVFDDVDFGGPEAGAPEAGGREAGAPEAGRPAAGAVRLLATVAARRPGGSITVRLDDPIDGPVLATLAAPVLSGRGELAEVTAGVPAVGGRHAVFVRFSAADVTAGSLTLFDG